MRIFIGSDHHGIQIRLNLGRFVASLGHDVVDVGPRPECPSPVDYPKVAQLVAEAVSTHEADIVKNLKVYCSGLDNDGKTVWSIFKEGASEDNTSNYPISDILSVELSCLHNDLNVLCLSAEMLPESAISDLVRTWLSVSFADGSRHSRRVKRVKEIEQQQIEKHLKR